MSSPTAANWSMERRPSPGREVPFPGHEYKQPSLAPKPVEMEQAFQMIGFGWFQLRFFIICGLPWMADAVEVTLISFIGGIVERDLNATPAQASLVVAGVFMGMFIGAFLWGVVADLYGRLAAFWGGVLLTFLAGVASAFAPTFEVLGLCRVLVGVGAASGHVSTTILMEFMPKQYRSASAALLGCFWTIGVLFEAGLALVTLEILELHWSWLLGLTAVPVGLIMFCAPLIPESPRYLLKVGRKDKAVEVLRYVASVNGNMLPESLELVEGKVEKERSFCDQLYDLCITHCKMTALIWLLFLSVNGNFYGLIIMAEDVFQYTDSIYKAVLLSSMFEVGAYILQMVVADWAGRTWNILLCCSISATAFLGLPFVAHDPIWCVVVAGLGRMACLSSYNTAFMYAPEVYPTALRSTGLGAASSIARISGMAAPFIVQLRHDELEVLGHTVTGLYLPCGVFCAMAVVAMGIALLAPESKGKSLDDDGTESVGGLELLAEVMGRGQRLPFRRYTSEPLVRRDPWQGQGFPRSNTGF